MNQNNISLERVINGLECCEHLSGEYCRQCPYHEDIAAETPPCCTGVLAHDALTLLKNLNKKLEETQRAYESALMAQYERPKGY